MRVQQVEDEVGGLRGDVVGLPVWRRVLLGVVAPDPDRDRPRRWHCSERLVESHRQYFRSVGW